MKTKIISLIVFLLAGTAVFVGAKLNVEHKQKIEIAEAENAKREKALKEYEEARYQLAIEVDNYITSVAPKSCIDPFLMIDLCSQYGVDIRFVMAQGQIESHYATKGTAAKTLSVFNVGAYDGHSASRQRRNGFGYSDPNDSIEPYLQLITNEYMVNGKTEKDLMKNYVNVLGMRYASNPRYEVMLRSVYNRINKRPSFRSAYENYLELQNKVAIC
jgi:flagellum-specific peptidoglycan hydrolase FlgJ